MPPEIRNLVPMVQVADVVRSISFYERLGFQVENTHAVPGESAPSWAWLERGEAKLMLARAESPIDRERQGVLFYLYYPDVSETKRELEGAGIESGAIEYPFYAPKGEFQVIDPDGYCLMITHT